MKKTLCIASIICLVSIIQTCVWTSARADAFSLFKIPAEPATPVITNVSNSAVAFGLSKFTVYARIKGVTQQKACCGDACDRTDCDPDDWYMVPDPTVSPNPPCIPNENGETGMPDASCKNPGIENPLVYYYKYDEIDMPQSVPMKYNAEKDLFVGDIPFDPSWIMGDTIYYYIVATDSAGNVTSMLPESGTAPCSSTTVWRTKYEPSASDNCSAQSGYEQCGVNITGSPSCAGTADFAVNDPEGDTCGEPDESGSQSLVSNAENVDILGFTAGAGIGYSALPNDEVVCTLIHLKGIPPTSSSGPIEFYQTAFFNPGISDPNPADSYLQNAFIITYAPEAAAADKNLVSVLWDGECLTNSSTSDISECKIVVGSENETKLKIGLGSNSHNLVMIAKNAVTTGTGSKTILDATTGSVKMRASTGEINLTGGTLFWTVDSTAGFSLMNKTFETTASGGVERPAAPIYKSITCKADGVGDSSVCSNGATKPANNQCDILIYPSPESIWVSKYKVYHNTNNDRSTAVYLPDLDITTDLDKVQTITYTVPQASLDGAEHYFFLSSINNDSGETVRSQWAITNPCRVEDWVAPNTPTGLACSTPDGFEKECLCTWDSNTSDPSLAGYNIKRNGFQINSSLILGTQYTDSELTNGTTYSYQIQAIDGGNNESVWDSASCMPQDLKPPEKVDSLSITFLPYQLGINAVWQPVSDTDVASYTLYGCYKDIAKPGSCDTKEGTATTNGYSALCTKTPGETLSCSIDTGFTEGETWCFYVEACDNCKADGTCPDKTGTDSNCSAFPYTNSYMKCLSLNIPTDSYAPRWPTNQSDGKEIKASPDPEGDACSLEWDKIYTEESDQGDITFADCDFPDPLELTGYYVMRAPATNNDCSTTSIEAPNNGGTPVATLGIMTAPHYSDGNLTNGTKYCYRVYGFDAAGNVSRDPGTPAPVECTPADIAAPDKPVVDTDTSGYSTIDSGCYMKWGAVEDKSAVLYNVYRCEGDLTACNSASMFNPPEGVADLTATEHLDTSVSTSVDAYSYCVTAKDPSGNESVKYDSADTANCFACYTGTQLCKKPGAVYAYEYDSNYGLMTNWTGSASDDSSYVSGEGYNVYLCTSSAAASCTTKINGDTPLQYFGQNYTRTHSDLSSFIVKSGDYYVGVSYTNIPTCKESPKTVSSMPASNGGKVHIEALPCTITIKGEGSNGAILYFSYDTSGSSYKTLPGERIELIDNSDPDTVLSVVYIGSDGVAPDMTAPLGVSGHRYTLRLRLSVASSPLKCNSTTSDYCYVNIKTSIVLPTIESTLTIKISPLPGEGAGGGDIGNPNCDNYINLQDILAIKNAYGTSSGDTCYRAWADFNGDGHVNLTDIIYVKDFYGEKIDEAFDVGNAVLCVSKNPLPACCSTKTCP